MTFKDCIRVLNENQTAKYMISCNEIDEFFHFWMFDRKQMLVPYRNSVLTSIFRPHLRNVVSKEDERSLHRYQDQSSREQEVAEKT